MKAQYLSRNLASAVVSANKILERAYPQVKILAETSSGKIPVFDVDELEESVLRESCCSRLFEGKPVEKTLYWLEMVNEAKGCIKGVHFSSDMVELGETVEFEVGRITE